MTTITKGMSIGKVMEISSSVSKRVFPFLSV